jgi:hypothetical protein
LNQILLKTAICSSFLLKHGHAKRLVRSITCLYFTARDRYFEPHYGGSRCAGGASRPIVVP